MPARGCPEPRQRGLRELSLAGTFKCQDLWMPEAGTACTTPSSLRTTETWRWRGRQVTCQPVTPDTSSLGVRRGGSQGHKIHSPPASDGDTSTRDESPFQGGKTGEQAPLLNKTHAPNGVPRGRGVEAWAEARSSPGAGCCVPSGQHRAVSSRSEPIACRSSAAGPAFLGRPLSCGDGAGG